jgi:thiol:disulfide interchange protein DsbA
MRNLFGSLLLALSLVAGFARALAAAPVAGKDYEVQKLPHPTSAPPGKVEVIEFFWYQDRNSYLLEATLEAFVKKEGDRILFKRVPVAFRIYFLPHSKLYYSLVSLGLGEKLMPAVYKEILHNGDQLITRDEQADFLATQAVDKQKFRDVCDSDTEMSLEKQGDKLRVDYDVRATPILFVAGRYKISTVNNAVDGMATVLDYVVKQVQDKKL